MFNRNPFNRAPFNRAIALETLFSVSIESATELFGKVNGVFPVTVIFDAATEMSTQMTREMTFAAEINTSTALLTKMIREWFILAGINTSAEVSVTVTYSHIDEFRFLGEFKPGDRLVIDTRKMAVTLNGQNAIHLFDGDFFEFALGNNLLTYSDGEAARAILTRITHRDKFLY